MARHTGRELTIPKREGPAFEVLKGQLQLGHRDINRTRIYLRLSSEDVMREVAKIQF